MTEKRFNFYDNVFKYMETGIMDNGDKLNGETVCDLLNELAEENKKLQERNDRQYKQLGDLYRLIEEKDWRALSDIMDDFQKAEEQLQKEWRTYGDIE